MTQWTVQVGEKKLVGRFCSVHYFYLDFIKCMKWTCVAFWIVPQNFKGHKTEFQ